MQLELIYPKLKRNGFCCSTIWTCLNRYCIQGFHDPKNNMTMNQTEYNESSKLSITYFLQVRYTHSPRSDCSFKNVSKSRNPSQKIPRLFQPSISLEALLHACSMREREREREREIPADTSPKKQFIRVSIQFVTLQYVRA